MKLNPTIERLSDQRAERIEELRSSGLAVDFIAPEIFGDGVINVDGEMEELDIDLYEDLNLLVEQKWQLFDAICLNSEDYFKGIRLQGIYQQPPSRKLLVGTQDPHQDDYKYVPSQFVMFSNQGRYQRRIDTVLMTGVSAREVNQAVQSAVDAAIAEGGSHDHIRNENEDQIANSFVDAVPHHRVNIKPGHHLIIHQKGPLNLHHCARHPDGMQVEFDPDRDQLWRMSTNVY